jgi:uncharacterized protein (TIGR00304 family)
MHYLVTTGILLIAVGFLLVFAGVAGSANAKTNVKGAGIIFIGPIPIALGTDRNSLILVSLIMAALMAAAYLIFRRGI